MRHHRAAIERQSPPLHDNQSACPHRVCRSELECNECDRVESLTNVDPECGGTYCRLSGTLPTQLARLTALQAISITTINNISGTLPSVIADLTALQTLVVSPWPPFHVPLYRTRISGTLPSQWASLSLLQTLRIDRGFLSGTLPRQFATMGSLQTLYARGPACTPRVRLVRRAPV